MEEVFSLECFVESCIFCALEIAKDNLNLLDYEKRFYDGISSKFGLDKNSVRYLENPIYWELFCNYEHPVLIKENLNLDVINRKILYFSKDLDRRNGRYFSYEDIVERTGNIFKLRMENTRVYLNGSTKSICEIRNSILEKNKKYFDARLRILNLK